MNPKKILVLAAVFAFATASAGCIDSVKNAFGSEEAATDEGVDPAKTDLGDTTPPTEPVKNATDATKPKPPVARISVFGPNGALVFKSDFVAGDDVSNAIITTPGVHSFLAADSEAVDGRAKLTEFTWSVAGMKMSGRKVEHNVSEAGIHVVSLLVKDSLGSMDAQMIHLVVPPQPFDVTEEKTGATVPDPANCGPGSETAAKHAVTIASAIDGANVKLLGLTGVLTPANGLPADDFDMHLLDAAGTEVGTASGSAVEALSVGALAAGEYTLVVTACIALPGDHTVTLTATYLPVVEGIEDGHGGHNH